MAARKTKNRPSRRFVMTSVSGYTIDPRSGKYARPRETTPTRSFAVLDTAYCYRIVAEFRSGDSKEKERKNELLARNLRDRLNRWAAKHGTEPLS
jgi:hypothetical protein